GLPVYKQFKLLPPIHKSGWQSVHITPPPGNGGLSNELKRPPELTPFVSKEAANVKNNSGGARKIAPANHATQLPRLKRIEGQVRGIQQMIENERDCVEIAHQINAVIAALRRVQGDMVRDHLTALAESSIAGKLPAAKARRLANDVGALMTRLG